MVKILYILFMLNFSFAADSLGIFDNYFKNETIMKESLKPSFNCAKARDGAEDYICFSTSAGKIPTPALMFIDNLFTSYYIIVVNHTPKSQQTTIKAIAKKAMQRRDRDFKNIICGNEMSSAYCQILHNDSIFEAYSLGIKELSQYLLKTNQSLLYAIFLNHTRQIVENGITEQGLDTLYQDNIINGVGKLIVKENLQKINESNKSQ